MGRRARVYFSRHTARDTNMHMKCHFHRVSTFDQNFTHFLAWAWLDPTNQINKRGVSGQIGSSFTLALSNRGTRRNVET